MAISPYRKFKGEARCQRTHASFKTKNCAIFMISIDHVSLRLSMRASGTTYNQFFFFKDFNY